MIDQIKIKTAESSSGKRFEQIRIWIAGIPFSADNSDYVEKVIRRFAHEQNLDVLDHRS